MVTQVRRASDAGNARAVPTWVPTSNLARAGNASRPHCSVIQPVRVGTESMVYEVIVLDPPEGGRFELECSEPLEKGERFVRPDIQPLRSYRALHVLPETADYDGVVEAEQVGGPSVDLGRTEA